MSAEALGRLKAAVFGALDGDVTLGNLVSGIYDHVPQGTEYPYVVLGTMESRARDMLGQQAIEATLSLEAVTDDAGRKSLTEILNRIRELLQDASLSLGEGYALANFRETVAEMDDDKGRGIQHGRLRFRALMELP